MNNNVFFETGKINKFDYKQKLILNNYHNLIY